MTTTLAQLTSATLFPTNASILLLPLLLAPTATHHLWWPLAQRRTSAHPSSVTMPALVAQTPTC